MSSLLTISFLPGLLAGQTLFFWGGGGGGVKRKVSANNLSTARGGSQLVVQGQICVNAGYRVCDY